MYFLSAAVPVTSSANADEQGAIAFTSIKPPIQEDFRWAGVLPNQTLNHGNLRPNHPTGPNIQEARQLEIRNVK